MARLPRPGYQRSRLAERETVLPGAAKLGMAKASGLLWTLVTRGGMSPEAGLHPRHQPAALGESWLWTWRAWVYVPVLPQIVTDFQEVWTSEPVRTLTLVHLLPRAAR